jgi:site-specific DNA-methyltransferase (adenine-specific)
MDEESVDAIVTDTPYGLSTLLDPPNLDREALWQKLIAGQAELPIKRLMRSWLDTGENPVMKGRGFMGKEWDALVPPPNTWLEAFRVLKPGAALLAFAGTRTHDLIAMSIRFAGFEVDDEIACWLYGQGMPKRVRLDLKIDQHFGKDKDRPNVGRSTRTEKRQDFDNGGMFVTGPATSEAARFVGYDRALRPGFEPIIVARKPCRGTIAATALAYGTGGFNVDACRIPRGDIPDSTRPVGSRPMFAGMDHHEREEWKSSPLGGYPANVVIDERVAELLDAQSGQSKSSAAVRRNGPDARMQFTSAPSGIRLSAGHADDGDASRFFYTAKASTSERDKGLDGLPALTPGEKTGRENDTQGISPYAGARGDGGRNPHPTVKPISLMRWLVRLAAPPGAHDPDISKRPVIVDMFAGSGSTLVAGLVEGVRVIGCEMDPQMADVSRRRCQHAYALPREEAGIERAEDAVLPKGQSSLF